MNSSDLFLLEQWISESEENNLIAQIDSLSWTGNGISSNSQIKRRMQQYGALFLMDRRCFSTTTEQFPILPIPAFLLEMAHKLSIQLNLPIEYFDYVVCNEYNLGQGICAHVDSLDFGPVICVVSLISECIMKFTSVTDSLKCEEIVLKPRSCLVMKGDARYNWKHSISKESIEVSSFGERIERSRRISIIFRSIVDKRHKTFISQ
jgi:alkylated DNA repair dioxygenase AlkB